MVNQIHARFSEKNLDAMDALHVMPNSVLTDSAWLVEFSRFVKKYESDLPEPSLCCDRIENVE